MRKLYQNSERLLQNQGGATSSLPMRQRIVGSEDAAPPGFAGFCKCLYNICSELQNLVSIAKVSAPLVFAEGSIINDVLLEGV